VDFATVGVAAVAAGVAVWQAFIARRARKDAEKASEAAEVHKAAALKAATDSAASLAGSEAATVRIAAAIEAAQAPRPRWVFHQDAEDPSKWTVVNNTPHRLNALLSFPGRDLAHDLLHDVPPSNRFKAVGPGDTMSFTWKLFLPDARRDAVVAVKWWVDGEPEIIDTFTVVMPPD